MPERLEIHSLGGLRILVDGSPVRGLASRKAEGLLVYLALQGGSPSRETLATLLWDDRSLSGSLSNLSVLLSSLRKDLGPFLRIDREAVSLEASSSWTCDALEFERQTELEAAVDNGLSSADADRLEQALEVYRGTFLEGFFLREARGFEEWAAVHRERLRLRAVESLRSLAALGLKTRQYRRGLRHVQRLLHLDLLSEGGYRAAMLLYARQGEMALALAQYQTCRNILQAELGVDPSFETTDLYYRLRSASQTRSRNLPAPPTGFVGRVDELARIDGNLADPQCRLVSLVGPGGVGKTRLAIEAASRLNAEFLDGACYVPLAGLETPEELAPALAEALHFTFQPDSEMKGQLLGYLRERETLLLLDGFEHLVEGAAFLGEVLAEAPRVKIIVTSRTHLRLLGEWVLPVEGLPYPEAAAFPLDSSYAAVDLFVQTALRAKSGFTLSDETLPWVLQICRRVDGHPLALEMAGAWLSTYSVREVAEEVERSLDFLAGAYRDLPERQRSLRAVFEHSWARLSEDEKAWVGSLSVFRGSFSREAALAIAQAGPGGLAALVDKSLLQRPSQDRYVVHELLRVYAAEKVAVTPAATADVQRRFRAYYADLLGRVAVDFAGRGQRQALVDLGQETENLRAAWQSAVQVRDLDALDRSTDGLFLFYIIRGLYQDGAGAFEIATRAVEEPEVSEDETRLHARLLVRAGAFHVELSHYERAKSLLQTGQALLVQPGREEELAFCLNRMGQLARKLGAYSEAKRLHDESLALGRTLDSDTTLANSHNGLGNAHYFLGEYQEARRHYRAARSLFETLGDQQGAGRCLLNLANVADRTGDFLAARDLYEQSLSLSQEVGDRWGVAAALNNLGNVALALEEDLEARRLYGESLAIKRELGNQEGIASSLDNLGRAAYRLNDLAEAKRLREAGLAIRRAIHDSWGIAYSLNGLGDVALAQGHAANAERAYREALETALSIKAPLLIEAVLVGWAELLWKQGERELPLEIIAGVLSRTTKDKLTRARAVRLRGEIAAIAAPDVVRRAELKVVGADPETLARELLNRQGPSAADSMRIEAAE